MGGSIGGYTTGAAGSSRKADSTAACVGCPSHDRGDAEEALGSAEVSVVWAENVAAVLADLQRQDVPVLLDLSRGPAALQSARDIRMQRASTLMFAVVDARRPDLTVE